MMESPRGRIRKATPLLRDLFSNERVEARDETKGEFGRTLRVASMALIPTNIIPINFMVIMVTRSREVWER